MKKERLKIILNKLDDVIHFTEKQKENMLENYENYDDKRVINDLSFLVCLKVDDEELLNYYLELISGYNYQIYNDINEIKNNINHDMESNIRMCQDFSNDDINVLNLIVSEISRKNYSPLENYLYVYNLTKFFKSYKENINNIDDSRFFPNILHNEYMVCAGYIMFMELFLDLLKINSHYYNVHIINNDTKHARSIVYIKDPKYHIDGYFSADPTWDNDLNEDYYNHAVIPFDKIGKEICNGNLCYFSPNIEEAFFKEKTENDFIKVLRNVHNKTCLSLYGKVNTITDEERNSLYSEYIYLANMLLLDLNPSLLHEFILKYPDAFSLYLHKTCMLDSICVEDKEKMLIDLYHHLHSKKVSIDLRTIINASCNIYKDVYNLNERSIRVYKQCLLASNLKREKKEFKTDKSL